MKRREIKAWIRIIEAFLGIMIVMSVVLVILSKQNADFKGSKEIYEKQRQVMDLISKNESLRGYILDEDYAKINSFISKILPSSLGFSTKICNLDDICSSGETPNNKDIYTTEIVITSTLMEYSPKKLRCFVWTK